MPAVLIFSDFDGTITLRDTGTVLIDSSLGYENRRALDLDIFDGVKSFREAVKIMWDSYSETWDEALDRLKDVGLDPEFHSLYEFCSKSSISLTVVSSGLKPIVEHFLAKYVTDPVVSIVANEVVIHEDHWEIIYHDETLFGHDKGKTIRDSIKRYQDLHSVRPKTVFIGDGISDISAARECDLVFAKKDKDLARWCRDNDLEFIEYSDFGIILEMVRDLFGK
ncbi:hypothetical protein HK098_006277 [Nowakowskiella sp. JEL0407]|nr:hypothetical protein HK098_006277 [Nowakowskiella sp. JEL0407]